jgi:hypothetical protein
MLLDARRDRTLHQITFAHLLITVSATWRKRIARTAGTFEGGPPEPKQGFVLSRDDPSVRREREDAVVRGKGKSEQGASCKLFFSDDP